MKLRCPLPECRKTFPWDTNTPHPKFCPVCGGGIGTSDAEDSAVVMPFIRSAKMAATDRTYRQMEAGSEVRVEKAAELTGATKEDMASLRITDMNDNMRAGDIAAKEADAAMARLQSTTRAPIGFTPNGAEFSAGIAQGAVAHNGQVVTGIEPHAGARAAQRVARKMQGW